jgi:hypothetical protein
MAEQTGSKLRYDDFIANVIPDPAKVEPTLLLSGFVGRVAGPREPSASTPSLR